MEKVYKVNAGMFKRRALNGVSCIRRPIGLLGLTAAMLVLTLPNPAKAFDVYQENGWEINLNTTVQYSGDIRVNSPSASALDKINLNDGDENLQHGLISNQFEVVPVLSVRKGNFGLHMSGEAFIDTVYLQRNQNGSPSTINYFVSNNQNFPRATQNINGRNAELLDAFAYDSVNFGAQDQQSMTFKVGRQTLLWGQSLFFTNNGIAAGQAPIDINKALNLANPQAQQIFLPVGQAVLTYQPNSWITLQGYYQFEWRYSQFPGSGSYFAPADFLTPGGSKLLLQEINLGHGVILPFYLSRANDLTPPSNNGQFGGSVKFELGNYDLGFYGLRFDDKTPQIYLNIAAGPPQVSSAGIKGGTYHVAYARDIQIYGSSLSSNIGPVNVAGELSGRIHQDLYSNAVPLVPGMNENSNPGYAVGDTINAQASAIYLSPGLPLIPGGVSVAGEIEANWVVAVQNRAALVSGRGPDGVGLQGTVTPNYYNVLPSLDLGIPIGLTWYPAGRSQFSPAEQAGTGLINIGVTATYRTVWTAGINYADYLGSTSTVAPGNMKQTYADRGNISFFLSRTF